MLRAPWFHTGLYCGTVAALFALAWGLAYRARNGRPAPSAALLAAGAMIVALQLIGPQSQGSLRLVISVLALVVGAGLATGLELPSRLWFLPLTPGAAFLAYQTGPSGPAWVSHLVFLTVVLGSALITDFDRRDHRGALGPAMALFSVAGVFLCIPDTDQALVMLGAMAPVALTGWPLRLARLGSIGLPAWIGLYAWTVATGGIARLGPIMAATACLGLLALEPVAHAVLCRARRAADKASPRHLWAHPTTLLLSAQLLFALVASRLAGVRSSFGRTVVVLVLSTVAAVVLLVFKLGKQSETIDSPGEKDADPRTP